MCCIPAQKSQYEMLSDHSIESTVRKGEIISRSDALISNIVYLKTGFVKEDMTGANHKTRIIQIIKPPSYLGIILFSATRSVIFIFGTAGPEDL
jgi:CRP-like cAMP-binding protein